jgi:hypothetical protein
MKHLIIITLLALAFTSCKQEATRASENLSVASKNFEVARRCIFYNSITDTYILTIEGRLSTSVEDGRLAVIVKVSDQTYLKHYLGLSDNVTYFVEQLESVKADPYHYRVVFRPLTVVPDIEIK